ncbi:MAG: hypothetical protein J6K77_07475 [Ruminococcus sp.]|nr:hypothetical protein [Ruminococcus sp.]
MGKLLDFFLYAILVAAPFFGIWLYLRSVNPRVNMEKLKRDIDGVSRLKERLAAVDELILDVQLKTLKKHNIRGKGITITWSDNVTGKEKNLNFIIDGDSTASDELIRLAYAVRSETKQSLMSKVYKLPKKRR